MDKFELVSMYKPPCPEQQRQEQLAWWRLQIPRVPGDCLGVRQVLHALHNRMGRCHGQLSNSCHFKTTVGSAFPVNSLVILIALILLSQSDKCHLQARSNDIFMEPVTSSKPGSLGDIQALIYLYSYYFLVG